MRVMKITDRLKDLLYSSILDLILLYNKILDKLNGRSDVIIVGEIYLDPYHAKIQAKLIEHYKPKYVLLELSQDEYKEEI